MVWQKSLPTSGTEVINIPTIFGGNWAAIENILGVEHYTFTSSLSGRHKPGIGGYMYSGATSAIAALSSPATGSIAFDTTLGVAKRYDGSAWVQMNLDPMSRVSTYRTGDQTVPTSITTIVGFNTETLGYDTLNEFSITTSKFSSIATGYYLIMGSFTLTCAEGGVECLMRIQHDDSSNVSLNRVHGYKYSLSTDAFNMVLLVVLSLAVGDKIYCTLTHDYSSTIVINGGADKTFLKIYKIS